MALLQFIKLATTVILIAANLARADLLENRSEIYMILKEALLTNDNVYALRNAFYPSDGTQISKVYIYVTVQVKYIQEGNDSSDGAFTYHSKCDCFERNDSIIVYSNNFETLPEYINQYQDYFLRPLDFSFVALLIVFKENLDYFSNPTPTELVLNMANLKSNPAITAYQESLYTLFTWVRL